MIPAQYRRPRLDHHSDGHVHARRLDAHHRQHDFPLGVWPGNRRRHGSRATLCFTCSVGWWLWLAQVAAAPHSTVPNLGASGAIAAVMGAFLVTYPRDQIRAVLFLFFFVRSPYIPAILLIGFWFLTQLFNVGAVATVQQGGVAYMAHVGGFIFGAITARLFEDSSRLGGG